jgi:hypothetical protein
MQILKLYRQLAKRTIVMQKKRRHASYTYRLGNEISIEKDPLPHGQEALIVSGNKRLLGLEDFAILVVAAVRAHAMRKLHLAALRANGTGRRSDAIVCATTGTSRHTTLALFRNCHDLFSFFNRTHSF